MEQPAKQTRVCVKGRCEKFKNAGLLFTLGAVIIAIVLLSSLLLYKARKRG